MHSELFKQIVDIMNKVQTSSSCHQKYQIVLLKLYKENEILFYDCCERILSSLLNQSPKVKNIHAERAVDFFATVCAGSESNKELHDELSLFEKVLHFLLGLHNLESEIVRYRVCQMLNKLLNNLSGRELDVDLCDNIEEALLERIQGDSKSEIRFQAVSAIHHLQDPSNHKCRIIPVLILHMCGDASAKVRKLCLEKVCNRRDVLVALVNRTRDVNTDVRLAAFMKVAKLVKYLKISERQVIIKNGFLDSSELIRNFVKSQLVSQWLTDYENDYFKFLKALRLDSSEKCTKKTVEVTKYVLSGLFSCRPCPEILEVLNINDSRTLDYKDLNWESAIYWRYLVETFRKSDQYELHVDRILPDLTDFARYIFQYYEPKSTTDSGLLEFQFILNQLFIITQGYDIGDTVSRQTLNQLIHNVLQNINLHLNVDIIIKNLENSVPKIEQRTQFVCEIISDIMYPTHVTENSKKIDDATFQISQLKVQLNCTHEKCLAAVEAGDFVKAAEYKAAREQLEKSIQFVQESIKTSQVVVKNTDASTILKCLNIARGLLISSQITVLSPVLKTLCEEIIIEHLMHLNETIRARALECYGLCCILDVTYAEKGIHIFSRYILASTTEDEFHDTECLIIAMKAIVDLLVLHGLDLLNQAHNEGNPTLITLTQIIQTLVDLMDDENVDVQVCAAQGLCNLILHQRINSASLLSRMILRWCNPDSEEEDMQRLRQIIGVMLEKYPTLAGSGNQMEKAVVPTIKALIKAPNTSPLAEVNVLDVIKFMLAMCNICEEATNTHANLAISICCEIRDHPDVEQKLGIALSKTLLMLDLSTDDKQCIKDLVGVCDEIRDDIRDRYVLNNIIKFITHLELLNADDPNLSVVIEENGVNEE